VNISLLLDFGIVVQDVFDFKSLRKIDEFKTSKDSYRVTIEEVSDIKLFNLRGKLCVQVFY